jgi:integrase
MRVMLKGIDSARKRLADGSTRIYYYAWRGGPRLEGEPGSAEFVACYNKAIVERPRPSLAKETIEALIDAYLDSQEFLKLAERTREDYRKIIKIVRAEFGAMPLKALPDKRARGEFLDWRDKLARRSLRLADYAWVVLARVLSWAKNRGKIDVNPREKGGRVYDGTRADKVWRDEEESAFRFAASKELTLAFDLAVWTGQRQGDLLALTWSRYDGAKIQLRQGKTGTHVVVPVFSALKARLDATPRRAVTILTTQAGHSWTADGFRASWGKAARKAGVRGLTFHDLRGTAVLRLALAGSTVPEIATITGHAVSDVQSILDVNYLHRDVELAESAVRKLEARFGNRAQVIDNK